MGNVTLNADDEELRMAKAAIRESGMTFNAAFRLWVKDINEQYRRQQQAKKAVDIMNKISRELNGLAGGRMPTRDEMNER